MGWARLGQISDGLGRVVIFRPLQGSSPDSTVIYISC